MSFYRTGTLAFTNGSTAVIGSGTDFINGAAIGECVSAPDGKLYEIAKINCAQGTTVVNSVTLPSIELGQPYLGATASGQTYSIVPTQSYIRDLASQAATLVNSYSATQANALTIAATDKTSIVDADKLGGRDSVSGLAKLFSFSAIKTALASWLAGGTLPISATTLSAGTVNFNSPFDPHKMRQGADRNLYIRSTDNNGGTAGGMGFLTIADDAATYTPMSFRASILDFLIGASVKATITSTGLAVTGGITAAGNTASGIVGSLVGSTNFGFRFTTSSTGAYEQLLSVGGGEVLSLGANHAAVAKISSTGLSVTGGISASKHVQYDDPAGDTVSLSGDGAVDSYFLACNYSNDAGVEEFSASGRASFRIKYKNAGVGIGTYFGYRAPTASVSAWTDQMILDASGNLGLGVVPSAWSAGNVAHQVGGSVSVRGIAGTEYAAFGSNFYNDNGGGKYIRNGYATQCVTSGGVHSWNTAPSGTAGAPISFTQAMTLDASGNLLVGQTTRGTVNANSFSFEVQGPYATSSHITGTAGSTAYHYFAYGGTAIGSITQSGTTAVLYNTSSDARLKENITASDDAASLIDSLQVRQFDWKSDGSHQRYGFVAQELYEVAPEAVSKPQDPDEMMSLDYSKLVPMLVKEVQSLRARVAQLEGI